MVIVNWLLAVAAALTLIVAVARTIRPREQWPADDPIFDDINWEGRS